jgi:hypothetical protein
MSQSLVTSGGATIGHPLVMNGSFIFNQTLGGHHEVSEFNMTEHFLGSNKGFEILASSVQDPLIICAQLPQETREANAWPWVSYLSCVG